MNLRNTVNAFALVMACTVLMAGCNQGSAENTSPVVQNDVNQSSSSLNGSVESTAPAAPDGGSQIQQPDLAGEIVSISGNSISLKLIDMSGMPGMQGRQTDSQDMSQNDGSGNGAPPESSGEGKPDGSQPKQGQPEGGQAGQGQPDGSQRGQRQMELKYTGETKTVTIPDGISITAFGRGDNGGQQQTVAISDLKQGEILQIWYSDKDKETVSRAAIMSFGGFTPNNGTEGNK